MKIPSNKQLLILDMTKFFNKTNRYVNYYVNIDMRIYHQLRRFYTTKNKYK